MTVSTQTSRRQRLSTGIAAVAISAAGLGLGVSAGTASAAPQQPQRPAQTVQAQHDLTVHRSDYRPFTYRGHRVTPRYNAAHRAWGFFDGRTFVRVVLDRR